MNKHLVAVVAWLVTSGSSPCSIGAAIIPVPNGSFESPTTAFVDLNIDLWQKSPKPGWYVEAGGFLWTQLTGTFKNTPPGNYDHIDNCDGDQAIWLFAVPEAGLFQDYDSVDWNDAAPSHQFDARFEVGKTYRLTVGVIAGGGGMSNLASAEISLYYRDAASNRVTVAAAGITNTSTVFSNRTQFVDYSVEARSVRPGDPWANRSIGLQLRSTVGIELQGGYWDFDNVRLSSAEEPAVSLLVAREGTNLRVEWLGAAGWGYQVQRSDELSSWADFGPRLNGTGSSLSTLVPTGDGSSTFLRLLARSPP